MKQRLLGKTPDELKEIALAAGLPAFAGKQMAQWLYLKRVRSVEEMTNLSKAGREALSRDWEVGYAAPVDCQTSADGTKKYLFEVSCPVAAGKEEVSCIEAVMIPDQDRKTLCVSSQAGCKMSCKFCIPRQPFRGRYPQPVLRHRGGWRALQCRFHGYGRTAGQLGRG